MLLNGVQVAVTIVNYHPTESGTWHLVLLADRTETLTKLIDKTYKHGYISVQICEGVELLAREDLPIINLITN